MAPAIDCALKQNIPPLGTTATRMTMPENATLTAMKIRPFISAQNPVRL